VSFTAYRYTREGVFFCPLKSVLRILKKKEVKGMIRSRGFNLKEIKIIIEFLEKGEDAKSYFEALLEFRSEKLKRPNEWFDNDLLFSLQEKLVEGGMDIFFIQRINKMITGKTMILSVEEIRGEVEKFI
jgi:hypothetical protein